MNRTDPKKKDPGAEKQLPKQTDVSANDKGKHLGSSNAFQETEDPASPDPDNITDEKLDEWLSE